MVHPWWRPPLFESSEDLEKKIEAYKEYVKERWVPMTLERLCVFLKCDLETLRNYSKEDEFFGTIKAIKDLILADKVERVNDKSTFTPGIIFDLTNNHKTHFQNKQDVTTWWDKLQWVIILPPKNQD